MNGLLVGAWLVISASSPGASDLAIPYASMHQCYTAIEQYAETHDKSGAYCLLGNNPMYGDTPKQPLKKK